MSETSSDVRAAIEAVERLLPPVFVDLDEDTSDIVLVASPNGQRQVIDLKPFRDARLDYPERRRGVARFTELASFIEHVRRFANEDTAIFAVDTPTAPKLIAVIDYHRKGHEGLPAWMAHRSEYPFPLSDEWKAWTSLADRQLDQSEFAAWLEDHVVDVLEPGTAGTSISDLARTIGIQLAGPSTLLAMARGISVHADSKVKSATNLSTGEVSIAYEETHRAGDGGALKIPGGFAVGVPVFRGGHPYSIAARLRYRLAGGSITWRIMLHRTDAVFEHAFREACARAATETECPVLFGSPET